MSDTPARRRGRHVEGARNNEVLLEAARDVFAIQGSGASLSAVAARAGLGIASLYRRYGSKAELLQRLCILAMDQAIAAANDALGYEDAIEGLDVYIRACVAFRSGSLAPLAGTIDATPEMWKLSRKSRKLHDAVVTRAHREGKLRPDVTAVDISWMIEQFSRSPLRTGDKDNDSIHLRLLAIAIDGLWATDAQPLPGAAPTVKHYESRWAPPSPSPSASGDHGSPFT